MKITRTFFNNFTPEIELTPEELHAAYAEVEREHIRADIEAAIDRQVEYDAISEDEAGALKADEIAIAQIIERIEHFDQSNYNESIDGIVEQYARAEGSDQ